jgi:hypothetical protein
MSATATIDRDAFRRALQRLLAVRVEPAGRVRYEAVRLRFDSERLELCLAGPLATAVVSVEAQVASDVRREVLVPMEILRRLTGRLQRGPVRLEGSDAGLQLGSGRFTAELDGLDPGRHATPLPALGSCPPVRTKATRFAHGLRHTVSGLGWRSRWRPDWAAVQFERQGDRLRLLGVDELSLTVADIRIEDSDARQGLSWAMALPELAQARAFLARRGDVGIYIAGDRVDICGDGTAFRCHTSPVKLPNCRPLLEPDGEVLARLRRRDLVDAVNRVAKLSPRFHPPVVALTIGSGRCSLEVIDPLRGRARAHCPAETGPSSCVIHLPLGSMLAMVRTAQTPHLNLRHEPARPTLSIESSGQTDVGLHLRVIAPEDAAVLDSTDPDDANRPTIRPRGLTA